MGKVTYSLRLPNEEYDAIIRAAARDRVSVREWLRRMIHDQLKGERGQPSS